MIQKSVQVELEAKGLADKGDYQQAQMVMCNFAAVARGEGFRGIADDMDDSSDLYASRHAYLGGGAQLSCARSTGKSRYRMSGAKIGGMSVGTRSQQAVVDSFTSKRFVVRTFFLERRVVGGHPRRAEAYPRARRQQDRQESS